MLFLTDICALVLADVSWFFSAAMWRPDNPPQRLLHGNHVPSRCCALWPRKWDFNLEWGNGSDAGPAEERGSWGGVRCHLWPGGLYHNTNWSLLENMIYIKLTYLSHSSTSQQLATLLLFVLWSKFVPSVSRKSQKEKVVYRGMLSPRPRDVKALPKVTQWVRGRGETRIQTSWLLGLCSQYLWHQNCSLHTLGFSASAVILF